MAQSLKERCLKWKKVLFEKALLDHMGHTAIKEESKLDLDSDGFDHFYRCPHCGTKNVVVIVKTPYGLPQIKISHIKE